MAAANSNTANSNAANDNRPAWFDEKLVRYMPGLRVRARRYRTDPHDIDDLVADAVAEALRAWRSCDPTAAFWRWLKWQMSHVVSEAKVANATNKRAGKVVDLDKARRVTVNGGQEASSDLRAAVKVLAATKHGDIVLRVAAGESFAEIGASRGRTKQAVQVAAARARRAIDGMAA